MNAPEKQSRALSYDPWRDFFSWENFFPADRAARQLPAVNISEDEKNYVVDVIAPGFKKEDFKVNIEDDVLTISAESKHESTEADEKKRYSRREYSYSSFTRSFKLPENTKDDGITATYADGVLKLNVPKSGQQVKATKQIAIK
ncbi:MAG: Hsp20/alpha crystallin family protein [Chitinophaga sp.]|uniref:Hsp20/alpha crystallin family protein n=1 Tax=Chitinophaga sp. TaxID=1869181 RepID=UPI0025BAB09E|nr:Hsp20/alpha crystallin family protein [Chitinophaga sp.]MBV8251290.1 Hsp20/alpha crystallin family protein [Chitinophaga sp.]